jgi:hypothetical protein
VPDPSSSLSNALPHLSIDKSKRLNVTMSDQLAHRGQASLHVPVTPPGTPPPGALKKPTKLSFGVVCSSNINRSMEAHLILGNAGLNVESYGTGTTVRLPGKSAMEPRVFKFGTPYAKMYESLAAAPEDEAFFKRNGVLQLCQRGAAVKVCMYCTPFL